MIPVGRLLAVGALLALSGLAVWPRRGWAEPVAAIGANGLSCEAAADEAEQAFDLPAGLLRAIGVVESGRWQPGPGRVAPWPFAIDADGYSLFMDDLPDAVAKVETLRRQGVESIDVGCFQINLFFHPDAFASLGEAFDPRANAMYAARFLVGLRARWGAWEPAVAAYHSAVSALGDPYRARVYAVWQGVPFAGSIDRNPLAVTLAMASPQGILRGVWPPAPSSPSFFLAPLHLAAPLVAVRVYGPATGPQSQSVVALGPAPSAHSIQRIGAIKRALPAVFTPSGRSP
jgi:hypothetical protein